MRRTKNGFTLVEMVVVVAVLLMLLMVVNTLYVGSAKQSRLGDEHATAAEHAATALDYIQADLRQMAVRAKPQPLSETYRLSKDRKSIAFLRSEPRVANTSAGENVSLVTLQLDVSPRGTGNYILNRGQEKDDGTKSVRTLPGIVLRDLRYDEIEQTGRNFLRLTVTAMARDEDLAVVAPEYAPKTYTVSSLFEVRQPEAPNAFTAGLPAVNALAAAAAPALPAPSATPDPIVPQVPIEKPKDVPPPPVARKVEPPAAPPGTPGQDPQAPGAPADPTSPTTDAPAVPPAPPAAANPWIAKGVRPQLRDPIQKILDSIKELYGDDYKSKIRGNVWGSFSVTDPNGARRQGSFSENYTIDFTGKSGVDPARQIERIVDRMAKISQEALSQFFRQHGVTMNDDVIKAIQQSVAGA